MQLSASVITDRGHEVMFDLDLTEDTPTISISTRDSMLNTVAEMGHVTTPDSLALSRALDVLLHAQGVKA